MTLNSISRRAFGAMCLMSMHVSAFGAAAGGGYDIITRWPAGGTEKWDYLAVDSLQRHLFVSRATHVQVFDLESGKLAGDIGNTPGVHGIAIATELNTGFISNGKADSVTVFDLKTLTRIENLKIPGNDPDAIIYDAPSQRVYTFNGRSNNATVIDAKTRRPIANVALPGRPEFAVSDGAGRIFVNLEDKAMVAVIDVAKGTVEATYPLSPCEEPTGIAMDRENHRLFSVCHNERLMVTDSVSGKRIAELPIGKHVDAAAFDPATSLVFASNGDSADVTVIAMNDADHYSVKGRLATAQGSKTMALDVTTHRIYVPAKGADGLDILVAAPMP